MFNIIKKIIKNQNYINEIDTEAGLEMLNTVIENLEDDKKDKLYLQQYIVLSALNSWRKQSS